MHATILRDRPSYFSYQTQESELAIILSVAAAALVASVGPTLAVKVRAACAQLGIAEIDLTVPAALVACNAAMGIEASGPLLAQADELVNQLGIGIETLVPQPVPPALQPPRRPRAQPAMPKLAVFDLDFTLWRPELYQLSSGSPFKACSDGAVVTSRGERLELFPAARTALRELADAGVPVAICADMCVPEPPYGTYGLHISSPPPAPTEGAGQLAPGGHCCTYDVHEPASGVPYVPRTAYRATPGHAVWGDNQRTVPKQVAVASRASEVAWAQEIMRLLRVDAKRTVAIYIYVSHIRWPASVLQAATLRRRPATLCNAGGRRHRLLAGCHPGRLQGEASSSSRGRSVSHGPFLGEAYAHAWRKQRWAATPAPVGAPLAPLAPLAPVGGYEQKP